MTPAPPLPEHLWNPASPDLRAALSALAQIHQEQLAACRTESPTSKPGSSLSPPVSPTGKKRGGQPKHRKAHRALVPAVKIHETFTCKPIRCRRRGHGLSGADPAPLIR